MPLYTQNDRTRSAEENQTGAGHSNGYRSQFRKDYGRLVHSAAFRRLQGKTQLFPGQDSDFFRNRLTHSLEVAQIAKCIVLKLNSEQDAPHQIDTDLIEFAGLAHDLGHPPFGHEGEQALNKLMRGHGGFEGNAQTLRILCCLERKVVGKNGNKVESFGLNLTYRSIASVLKYDKEIRGTSSGVKLEKGYYQEEAAVVSRAKQAVTGKKRQGHFKTIECSIMDIADDIAYATYDLEDSFKAGFLTPLEMIIGSEPILPTVVKSLNVALQKAGYPEASASKVKETLMRLIKESDVFGPEIGDQDADNVDSRAVLAATIHAASKNLASVAELRTAFTSKLVGRFVNAVQVKWNKNEPALSTAFLDEEALTELETLKTLTFERIVRSHRIRIVASRGKEIVSCVFNGIIANPALLPDIERDYYMSLKTAQEKRRCICDFVACLTDKECVDFYARLKSEEHQTIFKPVT